MTNAQDTGFVAVASAAAHDSTLNASNLLVTEGVVKQYERDPNNFVATTDVSALKDYTGVNALSVNGVSTLLVAEENNPFDVDVEIGTLSTVTIASDNSTTTLATIGDTVTLTIIASEPLQNVVATIGGGECVTVAGVDDEHFTCTRELDGTETEGVLDFTINAIDVGGNPIVEVVAKTGGSNVTSDFTAPTLDSAERIANTTIRVTLSELATTGSITKSNDGGFVVAMTGTPATTYAVTAIAPVGGNNLLVDLTVATVVGAAAVGVTVTYVNAANGTVQDATGNQMATDATGVLAAAWA